MICVNFLSLKNYSCVRLSDNPPVTIREGGVIAHGYDQELDELLSMSENAGDFLIAIGRTREKTHRILYVKSRIQSRAWLLY